MSDGRPPVDGVQPDAAPAGPSVELARDGKTALTITISSNAGEQSKSLAAELAAALKRITEAEFIVRPATSPSGIAVGTADEWPGLLPALRGDKLAAFQREDYLLRTERDRVLIIGRTALGLQNAVWDFLSELGFRQFFPGPTWAVWPKQRTISVAVARFETPSFYDRRLNIKWPVPTALRKLYATTPGAMERMTRSAAEIEEWRKRNRLVSGYLMEHAHAYGAIVARNPAHFAAHPEDIIPRDMGETRKLDASHASLLAIAAEDAIAQLERNPALDSISMEPSDGGGWRTDSPLGSPSNQAVTLANHVARAIQTKFPGRKVGMLAYNEHSPPPTIDVDPNVVITVTTQFIRGGYTVDTVFGGWRARKTTDFGVTEYIATVRGGDVPGDDRSTDLAYLAQAIPHQYDLGARYWSSDASRTWLPSGLGYYFISKLLWNVKNAEAQSRIADDFYRRAFDNVATEMKDFNERYVLASGRPLFSEDLVGRMYRDLQAALVKAMSPEVKARLVDYVVYARYLELFLAFNRSGRQLGGPAFKDLEKYLYRFVDSPVVNAGGFIFAFDGDLAHATPPASDWPTGPLSASEIGDVIRQGLANNRINSFDPVRFSSDLVPWKAPGPASSHRGAEVLSVIGNNNDQIYLFGNEPGPFVFDVQGGVLRQNRGPVRLRLFAEENPITGEPVAQAEVADFALQRVTLTSPYPGLHRLEVSDGNAGTRLSWPAGQRVSFPVAPDRQVGVISSYKFTGVFYVPKGTRVVGGYIKNASGQVALADGTLLLDFTTLEANSAFSIPVPAGQDGTWWQLNNAQSGVQLLTVPPFLARSPSELLVPRGVP